MAVLVLNAGSATLKATVVEPPDRPPRFARTVPWDGPGERVVGDLLEAASAATGTSSIEGVGHRVVHGGTRFTAPTRLDAEVVQALDELAELAPLHNPVAVDTIRAAMARLPGLPHVAVFDTAFHATLPEAAVRYPLPGSWLEDAAIRRYGFHGISVEWATRRAAELLGRPVESLGIVVAHLGGGCSVTAVEGGRSVDTSMGMTPLEGLMMGTRAGSIDPGIILRRLRAGHPPDEVERDLDRRSGLVGVADSSDMAALLERRSRGDAAAELAIDMFVRRAAAGVAASATALRALDAVVFTGGIGEHADPVVAAIRDRLPVVGPTTITEVDGDDRLERTASGPAILRVTAREDLVIADAVSVVAGV